MKVNLRTTQTPILQNRSILQFKLKRGHQVNHLGMDLQVPKTLLMKYRVRILKVILLKVFVIVTAR